MDKLIAERERGQLAKAIENNPLWKESLDAYVDALWKKWMGANASDLNALQEIHVEARCVEKIRKGIHQILVTGKLAEQALESIKDGKPT